MNNSLTKVAFAYILSVPVLAGLSAFEFQAEGFTVTGLVWVIQFAVGVCLLLALHLSGADSGKTADWYPWLAWAGMIWLSLSWCESLGRRNVQEAMQLSMPIMVGMVAAAAIRTRDSLRWLLRSFVVPLGLLAVFTAIFLFAPFDEEWLATRVRPAALTLALLGCIFLAGFPRRTVMPWVGWGLCVVLTTLTQSRMATMVLLIAPVIHPLYRSRRWNFGIAAGLAALSIALFYTPVFQQRFFESGSGQLKEALGSDYTGAGRFETWPLVWDQAWEHPLVGAGVGSAYDYVPTIWEEFYHIHNDYLRNFFELGAIGFTLFMFAIVWQAFSLRRHIANSRGMVQTAYVAVWFGFVGLLFSCATDNTIIYNIYYTDLLFALLGAAYGVTAQEAENRAEAALPVARGAAPRISFRTQRA